MSGAPVASLADYLAANQGLGAAGAALSDVAGAAGGLSGLLNPLTALPSIGLDLVSLLGGPDLNPLNAIMGALQGRPKMQATQDIAQGAQGYSDPVIKALGLGAGQTAAAGNPVSSPSAGSTMGPNFDVARKLEDLLRWGPGGLTDPHAQQLDAQTLSSAMNELGNPGKSGTDTLQALQQAFGQGSQYLTPQNIQSLMQGMDPQEQQILQGLIGNIGGQGASGSASPPPSGYQGQLQNYQDAYANYVNQYAQGQNVPPPTPPPPPSNPTVDQYRQYEQDYANYVNNYAQYQNQLRAQQPQGAPTQPAPQPRPNPIQNIDQLIGMQHGPSQRQAVKPLWHQPTQLQPGQQKVGQQTGDRPSNCPPCPPASGGTTTGGSQGGNTTGGSTTGGNQTGNTPNNPNSLNTLIQMLFGSQGGTGSGTGTGTTTPPPGGTGTTPYKLPAQGLSQLLSLAPLMGLMGGGGFQMGWSPV